MRSFYALIEVVKLLITKKFAMLPFAAHSTARFIVCRKNPFLKQQLKIIGPSSSAFKDMTDAEYVLRFLTLNERLEHFSGKLSHEMSNFMARHQHAKPAQVDVFSKSFERAIFRCEQLWGDNAFKRPEGDGWRTSFSLACTMLRCYPSQR
jgi:hypothetical protein